MIKSIYAFLLNPLFILAFLFLFSMRSVYSEIAFKSEVVFDNEPKSKVIFNDNFTNKNELKTPIKNKPKQNNISTTNKNKSISIPKNIVDSEEDVAKLIENLDSDSLYYLHNNKYILEQIKNSHVTLKEFKYEDKKYIDYDLKAKNNNLDNLHLYIYIFLSLIVVLSLFLFYRIYRSNKYEKRKSNK